MASAVPLIGLYVNGDNIFGSGQLEVSKDKVIYTGVLSTDWMQLDLLFRSVRRMGLINSFSKGKSPEVPFHGITSSYSYFEVI